MSRLPGQYFLVPALALLGVSCNCQATVKEFRVIRAEAQNQIRDMGSYIAFICPGESVALGWVVDGADKASIDNGVGPVPVPAGGPLVVSPTQDTHYTLTCEKGDCHDSKSVDVYVVTKGKTLSATASLIHRVPFVWEAQLLPQFYSPNILVTSARMLAPATQGAWKGNKTDVGGAQHAFDLPQAGQTAAPVLPNFSIPGGYDISPVLQTEVSDAPPGSASFELGLECPT